MIILVILARGLSVEPAHYEADLNLEVAKNAAPRTDNAIVFVSCGEQLPKVEPDTTYMIGECIAYEDLLINQKIDASLDWQPILFDQVETLIESSAEGTDIE